MTADMPDNATKAVDAAPALSPLLAIISDRLGALIIEHHSFRGDDRIHLDRANLVQAATILRDDPELAFDLLLDVTAIDYFGQPDDFEIKAEIWDRDRSAMRRLPQRRHQLVLPPRGPNPRFAVVYHLMSTTHAHRLRIKCRVP